MKPFITEAIEQPEQYYADYRQRVRALCEKMCEDMELPFLYEHMDYSAERMILWLDEKCNTLPGHHRKARYNVVILISLRGRVFTFRIYATRGNQSGWFCIWEPEVPQTINYLLKQIRKFLEKEKYLYASRDDLKEIVPGAITELGGDPAIAFNVLFGEMDDY